MNEKTKNDLERAKSVKQVKMTSNALNSARDKIIRDAMEAMRSANPWSVEKFLKAVGDPELHQELFKTLGLGKYCLFKYEPVF